MVAKGLVILAVFGLAVLAGLAGASTLAVGGYQPAPSTCDLLDIGCKTAETFINSIMPYLLPLIVFLILLFVVPKAGWRGVIVSIVGIFVLLWAYGLLGAFGLPGWFR